MSDAAPPPRALASAPRRGLATLGALLAGAGGVFGFAPFGWFPLLWLSLAICYGLLCRAKDDGQRAAHGAWLISSHAFGLFLAGVSWIYVSLSVFGGMPLPLSGLATLLFCALLASVALPFGALFVSLAPAQWLARGLFFAALFTLTEWARSWLFTGFPWLALGYSQVPDSP
ncbi:MAG TPA: apolipoprotein N-acyltransferase, partial [Accumulibacter sp.]|nr:apolipoprotein N-acyltransferase [Accumulibacter sp.]